MKTVSKGGALSKGLKYWGIFLAAGIIAWGAWRTLERPAGLSSFEDPERKETKAVSPRGPVVSATLYFPLRDLSKVVPFSVEVPNRRANLTEWVTTLVTALSVAPSERAVPLFPEDAAPRNVFLDEKGTLYVDFPSRITETSNAGVELELRVIEALSRTLGANVKEAEKLKILVDGSDRETLWGHVYIRQPARIPREEALPAEKN